MRRSPGLAALALGLLATAAPAPTARAAEPAEHVLRVATKPAPPFAYKDPSGQWTGTSIELWRDVAAELHLPYELHETDLDGLLAGVADGTYDAGVAAITVTSEREKVLDFTHPFYTTGLAIALPRASPSLLATITHVLTSREFLQAVTGLGVLFLLVGALIWLVERRANPDFAPRPGRGVADGFWWTVVTMTTVGYGDKTPRTAAGRLLALAWMLASVVIVSGFTATITATMTIDRLASRVSSAADLGKVRVGTVGQTTSESYLRGAHLDFRTYGAVDDGLRDLVAGEIDAFVYDAPLLRAAIRDDFARSVRLLPNTFQRQDYAFALPPGSPLREPINRVLPEKLRAREADEPPPEP